MERSNENSAGSQGALYAILWWKSDLPDQFALNYADGARCTRVHIDAHIGLAGGTYSRTLDKEHALALQAICLALHQRLEAIETIADNEDELILFHFSKEEWKPLEDYPVKKG